VHSRGITGVGAALLGAALMAGGAGPAAADRGGPLEAVSATGSGQLRSGGGVSISGDGRYVVFNSNVGDLVPADTNNDYDVFVRDRWTGTTSRINLSSTGQQTPADGENAGSSGGGSISADGRYVAFQSEARNLVSEATFGARSIFVRDRWAGTTRLVSVSADGTPIATDSSEEQISGNGRYVVYSRLDRIGDGDENTVADVFRYDLRTATVRSIPTSTTWSWMDVNGPRPQISADGRYVAFASDAVLTPGDTNGVQDVFVHDFVSGVTRKVSRSHTGGQTTADSYPGAMSADGRYVVFASTDATLVRGDTNGRSDVFVHDLRTGSTRLISVSSTGVQGDGMSYEWMTVSGDGRYVGFGSLAGTLVPGDTNGLLDVFVHDRRTARTQRISEPNRGGESAGESLGPIISADGRQIAFTSTALLLGGGEDSGIHNYVYARPLTVRAAD
jgi:Tol biopolymer transport system component